MLQKQGEYVRETGRVCERDRESVLERQGDCIKENGRVC